MGVGLYGRRRGGSAASKAGWRYVLGITILPI